MWRQDDTPVVEIEVLNEGEIPVAFYRSDLPDGDPYRLSLVDKVCTFTPASDTPFNVYGGLHMMHLGRKRDIGCSR